MCSLFFLLLGLCFVSRSSLPPDLVGDKVAFGGDYLLIILD